MGVFTQHTSGLLFYLCNRKVAILKSFLKGCKRFHKGYLGSLFVRFHTHFITSNFRICFNKYVTLPKLIVFQLILFFLLFFSFLFNFCCCHENVQILPFVGEWDSSVAQASFGRRNGLKEKQQKIKKVIWDEKQTFERKTSSCLRQKNWVWNKAWQLRCNFSKKQTVGRDHLA